MYVRIISAKYGLMKLDDIARSYDIKIKFPSSKRKKKIINISLEVA